MKFMKTGIFAVFWNEILERTDVTNKVQQSSKMDINTGVASLCFSIRFTQSEPEYSEKCERKGAEKSGAVEYTEKVVNHFVMRC